MTKTLKTRLSLALQENDNKIPFSFIQNEVKTAKVNYFQLSPNMRVCVIRLQSGHEVLGKAQVLDAANDEETVGNNVAFENAQDELWSVFGAIALSL